MSFYILLVFGLTHHNLSNLFAIPPQVKTSAAVAVGESVTLTTAMELEMSTSVKPINTSIFKSQERI